jgi:aspartate 1-decarboxylase
MLRIMCKSKIKEAVVTGKDLHYDGSIGIDKDVMKAADILPGEQVHVLDVENGERFITYAIEERAGSGNIVLYGPAARMGEPGDEVVILTYCSMEDNECRGSKMRVVSLKKKNRTAKK